MRSESEMFDLILNIAKVDDRIKAVYMTGSRTNPNIKKDIFQDYDIIYVVNETDSFITDKNWIDLFGERLYMQYPEDSYYYENNIEECYGWLIQFKDGNRLDLHVVTLSYALKDIKNETLCKILLDKNNVLPNIEKSSDSKYWVKKPVEKEFIDTCNEFWWCLNNVAKGLWREETIYTLNMINNVIRPQLIKLLEWKIGFENDFKVSCGKSGKFIKKYLNNNMWESLLKTYSNAKSEDIWHSVFIMCDLFDKVALELSKGLNMNYNKLEAKNSLKFLKDVYKLPKDANEIY
ncbi:MAG: aminoglycoside 6-adenylyltransferase [Oceanotoga sp.]|jgi:aminoglycoside 6-adenylyltransferase|uniref:aminoglycoside 6-adenylyltransferase n=1 Tax=Oceanotoga sp. TaxID=2108366 RepID=UPI002653496E|nr:aminoglycoside 6-adenylyltransferase [Oceanotoga sp.]MDN5342584.1 aminoglycoside 6-adenylyltransferase [Oceanotoga sp.]